AGQALGFHDASRDGFERRRREKISYSQDSDFASGLESVLDSAVRSVYTVAAERAEDREGGVSKT
ncbi:MAG: hypothetical protein JW843_11230, partial [Candidatus Aminicenantes bacterium]|nr:hypothetical protein [Candidatus Aminicenantes bacterium]